MPRLIDHSQRQGELVNTVWSLLREGGLSAVSVRAVADRAGLSTGSVRHSFPAQHDLVIFAMRTVVDRIRARVLAEQATGSLVDNAWRQLRHLLPLDDTSRVESQVWLAFSSPALTDPHLQHLREEAHDELLALCRRVVDDLARDSSPDRARDRDAHHLHALIDGLLIHGVIRPASMTPDLIEDVVRDTLSRLTILGR